MSISFTLTKLCRKWHNLDEHYQTDEDKKQTEESGMFQFTAGGVIHTCEDQKMDSLSIENREFIEITINTIPFITFRIYPADRDKLTSLKYDKIKYRLYSFSPISLRTYERMATEQETEDWGLYDEIGDCVNKAINITAGFTNGLKTGEINDGNYYEDDKG